MIDEIKKDVEKLVEEEKLLMIIALLYNLGYRLTGKEDKNKCGDT